jgi:hypothetical protein
MKLGIPMIRTILDIRTTMRVRMILGILTILRI